MKKILVSILALGMILFAFTGCLPEEAEDTKAGTTQAEAEAVAVQDDTEDTQNESDDNFGAKGALDGGSYTLEEMLQYAIQDEYLARQEYELIMEEYGEQNPFSNIIKAEENHIAWLKEIYEKYDMEIPEDTAIDHAVVPESLDLTYEIGVQAEIDNIAMYEMFLKEDLPDDVRDLFIELRDASKNHLAAFEKGPRGQGNH